MSSKKLEVLLLKRFPGLGYQGEVVFVKRGFARNFLIVKGVAVTMTPKRAKERDALLEASQVQKDEFKDVARDKSKKLAEHVFSIKAIVDVKGNLYGSVTSSQIVQLINKFFGENIIVKKDIIMPAPIKVLGKHNIQVRLFKHKEEEVFGEANIDIIPEDSSGIVKSRDKEWVHKKEDGAPKEDMSQKEEDHSKEELENVGE